MIADCSVAGGAESLVSQDIDCSVVGGIGGFVVVGVEFLACILGWFCILPYQSSCALPHSYKWGNAVPMSIPAAYLGITMALGIAATGMVLLSG